jgi:hypothetical protein
MPLDERSVRNGNAPIQKYTGAFGGRRLQAGLVGSAGATPHGRSRRDVDPRQQGLVL